MKKITLSRLDFGLLALEERQLVDAVDGAILRHDVGADGRGERREKIDLVDDLVRHPAGGNAARPADDARRADAAFHHACCRSRSTARRSAPRPPLLGAVVGAPEHDRVARDAQPVDRVEHEADVVDPPPPSRRRCRPRRSCRRSPDARASGSGSASSGSRGRTACCSRTLRSMNATLRSADSRSIVRRVSRSNTFTLRDGSPALPSQMNGRVRRRSDPGRSSSAPRCSCAGCRTTRRSPECDGSRPSGTIAAEVPLAEERRGVADRLQRLGDGDFPQRDAAALRRAGADRVAPGQQRGARDGAGELDVEVVEPDALGGELVDARRRHAAHAAVDADLAPSEVVGEDQTMLGRAGWACRMPR